MKKNTCQNNGYRKRLHADSFGQGAQFSTYVTQCEVMVKWLWGEQIGVVGLGCMGRGGKKKKKKGGPCGA